MYTEPKTIPRPVKFTTTDIVKLAVNEYYPHFWDIDRIRLFVKIGLISEEHFEYITGQEYEK